MNPGEEIINIVPGAMEFLFDNLTSRISISQTPEHDLQRMINQMMKLDKKVCICSIKNAIETTTTFLCAFTNHFCLRLHSSKVEDIIFWIQNHSEVEAEVHLLVYNAWLAWLYFKAFSNFTQCSCMLQEVMIGRNRADEL